MKLAKCWMTQCSGLIIDFSWLPIGQGDVGRGENPPVPCFCRAVPATRPIFSQNTVDCFYITLGNTVDCFYPITLPRAPESSGSWLCYQHSRLSHYPLSSLSLTVDCIKLQSAVNPGLSIIVDCLFSTVDYL